MTIRHALSGVLLIGGLVAMSACSAAPRQRPVEGGPVDTGAGTLTTARRFLEGRWALESFELRPPGKAPIMLKGQGTLLYDESGNLNMQIRADEGSSDLLRANGVDIRDGVISTEGRTAIDLQNRTLTYVLQGQKPLIRGPLGIERPRHWVVEGDVLTLTTKDDGGQPLSVGRWRRSQGQ
jgi:hypothetical protein